MKATCWYTKKRRPLKVEFNISATEKGPAADLEVREHINKHFKWFGVKTRWAYDTHYSPKNDPKLPAPERRL